MIEVEYATLIKRPSRNESHEEELHEAALRKLPREERIARVREQHRRTVRCGAKQDGRAPGVEYRGR